MTNGIDQLHWLREQMGQFRNGGAAAEAGGYPTINVWDDGERFRAEVELPGFKIEDVELFVAGSQLQIRARRTFEPREGWTLHRQERASGQFSRMVTLPVELDADKVQAALKDGILSVTLPKAPSAKPRKIEVKVPTPQK
jgi:HSP20 family protein